MPRQIPFLQFPKIIVVLFQIPIGFMPCLKSIQPSLTTIHGHWFLSPLMPILSWANESLSTNSIPMALLLATRLDGLFATTLNNPTLILTRHSAQSSNHPPFELFLALPSPALGPSINSMSRMSFFMSILMRVYCLTTFEFC